MDFNIYPTSGVLEPLQDSKIIVTFEPTTQSVHKKNIKIEVTDTQNLLGLLQNIPIAILAEAYNVALDVS